MFQKASEGWDIDTVYLTMAVALTELTSMCESTAMLRLPRRWLLSTWTCLLCLSLTARFSSWVDTRVQESSRCRKATSSVWRQSYVTGSLTTTAHGFHQACCCCCCRRRFNSAFFPPSTLLFHPPSAAGTGTGGMHGSGSMARLGLRSYNNALN